MLRWFVTFQPHSRVNRCLAFHKALRTAATAPVTPHPRYRDKLLINKLNVKTRDLRWALTWAKAQSAAVLSATYSLRYKPFPEHARCATNNAGLGNFVFLSLGIDP